MGQASKRDILTAIGLSAWVAGLLDLMVAVLPLVREKAPLGPVLATGRGVITDPSGSGLTAVALGVGAHFLLMLMIAAIFVLAARKVAVVAARPVTFGVLYGVALYFLMPTWGEAPVGMRDIILEIVRDVLCIGLPMGLITWWVQKRAEPPRS
jgi:hypothetical protein